MLVELFYPENRSKFIDCGVSPSHVLPLSEISSHIVFHASLHPGSSRLIYEILSANRPQTLQAEERRAHQVFKDQNGSPNLGKCFLDMRCQTHDLLLGVNQPQRDPSAPLAFNNSDMATLVRDTDRLIFLRQTSRFEKLKTTTKAWAGHDWAPPFRLCERGDDNGEFLLVVGPHEDTADHARDMAKLAGAVIHICPDPRKDGDKDNLKNETAEAESLVLKPHESSRGNYIRFDTGLMTEPVLKACLDSAREGGAPFAPLQISRVILFGPHRLTMIGVPPFSQDEPTLRRARTIRTFLNKHPEYSYHPEEAKRGTDSSAVHFVAEQRSKRNHELFLEVVQQPHPDRLSHRAVRADDDLQPRRDHRATAHPAGDRRGV